MVSPVGGKDILTFVAASYTAPKTRTDSSK